jgi:hypothetical protein
MLEQERYSIKFQAMDISAGIWKNILKIRLRYLHA